MDPQQLAMILQSLPPQQRMQMQALMGGGGGMGMATAPAAMAGTAPVQGWAAPPGAGGPTGNGLPEVAGGSPQPGGMAPQPGAMPGAQGGGGLGAILAALGGGRPGMGNQTAQPGLMMNRKGQPLTANQAGWAGVGQAAGAPDAWKMTPAQAMSGALNGFAAGKRNQAAALDARQQGQLGQSQLMNILKMLQGQQSYGTTGYAQTPVLGPGGRLGGGV